MKICFDFDGVIHSFVTPWKGDDVIPDKPTTGCEEALDRVKAFGVTIYVHSTRCHCPEGRRAIRKYMNKYKLPFDAVVEHKPIADLYIDDRAVLFSNNWPDTIELIFKAAQDDQGVEREKLNEIFAEELEETDRWGQVGDSQTELKYKPLFLKVRSISNTHDLMELIEMGLPETEYDPETKRILPLLNNCRNVVDLAIGISSIYNEMFFDQFKPSDQTIFSFSKDLFQLKEEEAISKMGKSKDNK